MDYSTAKTSWLLRFWESLYRSRFVMRIYIYNAADRCCLTNANQLFLLVSTNKVLTGSIRRVALCQFKDQEEVLLNKL